MADLQEYKVVMLGDGAVGKSAMTIQFVQNHFIDEYDPTIEDSYRRQIVFDDHAAMLDILDTAGQEDYSAMSQKYMRSGEGFVLMYSINSIQSFAKIEMFYTKIARLKEGDSFPAIVVGNKCDLSGADRQVTTDAGVDLAKRLNCEFHEASAKNRINVDETFNIVARAIREEREKANRKQRDEKESSYCCRVM